MQYRAVQCRLLQFLNIVDLFDNVIMKPNAILVYFIAIADFECL